MTVRLPAAPSAHFDPCGDQGPRTLGEIPLCDLPAGHPSDRHCGPLLSVLGEATWDYGAIGSAKGAHRSAPRFLWAACPRPDLWARAIARGSGHRACRRCGHVEALHTKTTGPNSIGKFWHNGCTEGATYVVPYIVGGCSCLSFSQQPWWRRWFR